MNRMGMHRRLLKVLLGLATGPKCPHDTFDFIEFKCLRNKHGAPFGCCECWLLAALTFDEVMEDMLERVHSGTFEDESESMEALPRQVKAIRPDYSNMLDWAKDWCRGVSLGKLRAHVPKADLPTNEGDDDEGVRCET